MKATAFLAHGDILKSIPLKDPAMRVFTVEPTKETYRGYLVDVAALSLEQKKAIYDDMKKRGLDVPAFDIWEAIITKQGLPIREERVDHVVFGISGRMVY
jgi:hypothetical protein